MRYFSCAKSMAFGSQRVVPGSDGGNLPERTQFENAVGERLQYAAACCRFSKRGLSCVIEDASGGVKTIFELTPGIVVPQRKIVRADGPPWSSKSQLYG